MKHHTLKPFTKESNGEAMKILLLEDDDGDAKEFERGFKKSGIAIPIIRAVNGIDALGILRKEKPSSSLYPPYIIIADINMPQMDGLEFVKQVRQDEQLSKSIIFMLTTSKNTRDIEIAYMHNVAGYICKQTISNDFTTLISLMNTYWNLVELPE